MQRWSCEAAPERRGKIHEGRSKSMLVLRKGCAVPFPEKLSEEYMVMDHRILANISADMTCA